MPSEEYSLCDGHFRGPGRGEPAPDPRPPGRRGAAGRRPRRDPGPEPARRLQAPQGPARAPAWSSPAPTPSGGSTGSGPNRCERSTSGWRPTGGGGPSISTPWSATSRSWRAATRRRGHERGGRGGDDELGTLERARRRVGPALPAPPGPPAAEGVGVPSRRTGTWRPGSRRRSKGSGAAGAPLHFSFRQSEGEPFDGEMLAFVPPSLMELRWADDVLRFELEPDGAGCILRLTVTFPEHGKAARDAAGWHVCLEQLERRLRRHRPPLATRPTAGGSSTLATSSASGPRRRPSGRPRSGSGPRAAGAGQSGAERQVEQPAEREAGAPVRLVLAGAPWSRTGPAAR